MAFSFEIPELFTPLPGARYYVGEDVEVGLC